jgi:hypothetical protein
MCESKSGTRPASGRNASHRPLYRPQRRQLQSRKSVAADVVALPSCDAVSFVLHRGVGVFTPGGNNREERLNRSTGTVPGVEEASRGKRVEKGYDPQQVQGGEVSRTVIGSCSGL